MTVVETLISLLDQTIIGIWSVVKRFEAILVQQQSLPNLAGFFLDPPTIHKTKLMSFPIWSYLESRIFQTEQRKAARWRTY